jgi:hypothetical protein
MKGPSGIRVEVFYFVESRLKTQDFTVNFLDRNVYKNYVKAVMIK